MLSGERRKNKFYYWLHQPQQVGLHNKSIHFAVMNCWSVSGLRWRDLCIIVLCQDIAAIDSFDTKLSPWLSPPLQHYTQLMLHWLRLTQTDWPVHLFVLGQDQVVAGERHTEDDGGDPLETVDPLLSLWSLASNIKHPEIRWTSGPRTGGERCEENHQQDTTTSLHLNIYINDLRAKEVIFILNISAASSLQLGIK